MSAGEHQPMEPEKVVAVLLADGWHQVVPRSFTVGPLLALESAPAGFRFEEADNGAAFGPAVFSGALDNVLAVRQVGPQSRTSAAALSAELVDRPSQVPRHPSRQPVG
jgi:hypothetical protein